jgi:hypothetical protein
VHARGQPSLILFAKEPLPSRQHLNLRSPSHQPLATIKNLNTMRGFRRNYRNPNQNPPMKFKMPNLTNGDLKPAANLSNDRPNKPALLLERMHIPKKQINLQDPSKHVLFRPKRGWW